MSEERHARIAQLNAQREELRVEREHSMACARAGLLAWAEVYPRLGAISRELQKMARELRDMATEARGLMPEKSNPAPLDFKLSHDQRNPGGRGKPPPGTIKGVR